MGMINYTHVVHDLTMAFINDALAKDELTNDVETLSKTYDEKRREFEKIFKN